jgi:GLPGLI family protein
MVTKIKVGVCTLLLAFVFGAVQSSTAQVKIQEGIVDYDITYPELTAEMKQMEDMLPKTLKIHFRKDQSRTEMEIGGGTTTSIANGSKKEIVVLMDMMGKKIALKQDAEALQKKINSQKQAGQYPTDITVTPSKETKQIAGYNCKRATISYKLNGVTEKMDCYYTTELPKAVNNLDNPAMSKVEGFLMEYNISQAGMKMRIKAAKVTPTPVPETMFSIPAEYKMVTMEELEKMMGE